MVPNFIMKKRDVLQLVLQLNFIIVEDTYNSLYLYDVSANEQVAWVGELQLIVYTMQFIVTQLQLNQNNSFSTIMQFHYNCTHDVMLTSLIVIHLLIFDRWHYEIFWTYKLLFFQDIDLHRSLWLLMMVWYYDMWHIKICHITY
jgi:hypothetical protein